MKGREMIDLDVYPVKSPEAYGKIVDSEAVLVMTQLGQVKVLNDVGARIWSLANGSNSIGDIVNQIYAEYQVDQEQAQRDTSEFIDSLVHIGILKISEVSVAVEPFE